MSIRGTWIRHAATFLRWSRVMCYLSLVLSGMAALAFPPVSVEDASGGGWIIYVWAASMILSGLICAVGAISDRWVGEYVGLVPLALTAAVFAVSAFARGASGLTGAAFLGAVFWIFASRWQEVALIRIESTRHAERARENGDT